MGTDTATLDYDPVGRLERYTTLSGTHNDVVYDGIDMIMRKVGGSVTRRWVHGPGTNEPLVEYTGSGTSSRAFLHADAQGLRRARRSPRASRLSFEASPTPTPAGR